jgi:hypothetical protein
VLAGSVLIKHAFISSFYIKQAKDAMILFKNESNLMKENQNNATPSNRCHSTLNEYRPIYVQDLK